MAIMTTMYAAGWFTEMRWEGIPIIRNSGNFRKSEISWTTASRDGKKVRSIDLLITVSKGVGRERSQGMSSFRYRMMRNCPSNKKVFWSVFTVFVYKRMFTSLSTGLLTKEVSKLASFTACKQCKRDLGKRLFYKKTVNAPGKRVNSFRNWHPQEVCGVPGSPQESCWRQPSVERLMFWYEVSKLIKSYSWQE